MTEPEREPQGFRRLRAYRAEDRAVQLCPLPPLDGTQKTAQAYVDRITRSAWWRRHCPPSWLGDETFGAARGGWLDSSQPPRRIIVRITHGGSGRASTQTVRQYRGRWFPYINLGPKLDDPRPHWPHPPSQSQWIVLHEVAHILAACRDDSQNAHGRVFCIAYLDLVRRFAGPEAARALVAGYKAEGLKYRRQS